MDRYLKREKALIEIELDKVEIKRAELDLEEEGLKESYKKILLEIEEKNLHTTLEDCIAGKCWFIQY